MSLAKNTTAVQELSCYHCGNICPDNGIYTEDKHFCCEGCKTVYEILESNNLCQYYHIEKTPGHSPQQAKFGFLDNPEIVNQLLDFQNSTLSKITFYIPTIHCSSCLWLLENLYRIHTGIATSQVDFIKKQVSVTFKHEVISLRQLAELLTSIGYEPLLSLNDVVKENQKPSYRPLLTRIAVAGFCAGNIMLFSFPDYLGLNDPTYQRLFGYLNLILALPVVFYSASGYFESVWKSLKAKTINIDFPILLGILVAFFRSTYSVLLYNEAGFYDSLTGLVFFLLVGKWFQQRTYDFLSFERDYKSYFPLAVTLLNRGKEEPLPVASLRKGDKILIRSNELIPADGLLYKGKAQIDYSFVTGESETEIHHPGDLLYAGGRQMGESVEMEVLKDVSQSYLTQLWNNDTFRKNQVSRLKSFADIVGKYFTITVLTLAIGVATYWYFNDPSKAMNAFTAVLIIACPCALALSYPFALGNSLRILGKQHFYLKNSEAIEQMAHCDTIVFDKTGTLTCGTELPPSFEGPRPLTEYEQMLVASVVRHSMHPLSLRIKRLLNEPIYLGVEYYLETPGQGIQGMADGHAIKIGSAELVQIPTEKNPRNTHTHSVVHIRIGEEYLGYYALPNSYREGIGEMIHGLKDRYELFVLSGDGASEKVVLLEWFDKPENIHFRCQPQQKLDFIKKLQKQGRKVVMIGDGLNDAGALKQADVGIAVTDNTINFTPASDAILEAIHLMKLPQFLRYSRYNLTIIRISFLISLLYNLIGLSYALTGDLSPVVAAILMPISSITMVVFATVTTVWKGTTLFRILSEVNHHQR